MQGAGRLGKAQAEVIQQLSRREPELMLPILQLHLEATRTYTDRREWYLANHSRRLAGAVAESYAEGGGSQGARVMASRAFTTLGGTLQEGMASESCRCVPFYERALYFDPSDEAARLGLATVFEKAADYDRAVEELQTLVSYHPGNHEARLRLAINLKRTARDEEAEAELTRLTATTESNAEAAIPRWVVSLAYQERVRSLMDGGEWAAAEGLLTEAQARFPNHQRLTVLHAFVLEQTRRPKQARRVLEALQGEPLEADDTPRLLYTRMPEDLIRAAEEALRQGAESRLSLLKTALERVEGGMW
jgi:Flp pilus assembly protein TadD